MSSNDKNSNLLKQAMEQLDNIEYIMKTLFGRIEAKYNAMLREGKCFYDGHMRLKEDGKCVFREDAPRTLYEELEPYCYAKINSLLDEGRIRYRKGRLIIRN
jgi:hypothetical protein